MNFMTSKQWRSLANIFFVCLISLGITFTTTLIPTVSAANEPSTNQIIDRFEAIKNKMAKLRFRQFKDEMQRGLMKQRILRKGCDSQEIFSVCDL